MPTVPKGLPDPGHWRGLHIKAPTHKSMADTLRLCREYLPDLGINVLIVEVNYRFRFQSHPELSEGDLTFDDARQLVSVCQQHGIRVIPQFQTLGHQSWGTHKNALLARYPHLDESAHERHRKIQSRSWCPLHPETNPIVFRLMDELIDAFQTPILHVGLDEVKEIGRCVRCRDHAPADLFARAVGDMHAHLTSRGVRMMMWADGLLDAAAMMGRSTEATASGTHAAIDRIPRDILLCPWHYLPARSYPSIAYLLEQGFLIWPSSWRSLPAAQALLDATRAARTPKALGMLFTCWTCGKGAPGLLKALRGLPPKGSFDQDSRQVLAVLRSLARQVGPASSDGSRPGLSVATPAEESQTQED